MNQPQYTTLKVTPHNEWVEQISPSIELLQIKMRRAGIDMTDEQAYKYWAWCYANCVQNIAAISPTASDMVTTIMSAMGEACSANYKQQRTGILAPPQGPRFNTPAEAEQQLGRTPVSKETVKDERAHGGYL